MEEKKEKEIERMEEKLNEGWEKYNNWDVVSIFFAVHVTAWVCVFVVG